MKKSKKRKIVNNFVISKQLVYIASARNGNGAGIRAKTLKEAVKFAKEYSWYEGS